jgi:hypothetical protein
LIWTKGTLPVFRLIGTYDRSEGRMSESAEEANGVMLCQKATRLRGESTEKDKFWRLAQWALSS